MKRKQNLDYLVTSINASIFPQSLGKSAKNNQVTKRKERNGETLRSWSSGDWEQEQTFCEMGAKPVWENGEKQQPPRLVKERLKSQTCLLNLGACAGEGKTQQSSSHTLGPLHSLYQAERELGNISQKFQGGEEREILAYKYLYPLLWLGGNTKTVAWCDHHQSPRQCYTL